MCGIKPDQAEADFSRWGLNPADAQLLAFDLKFSSPLKRLNLCANDLGSESKTIAQAVLQHTSMEVFCEIPMKELRAGSLTELNMTKKFIGIHGAIVLADLLEVSSPLTDLNLEENGIGDEGAKALAEVLPKW